MKTTKALPVTLLTAISMIFAAGAFGQEVVPITATLPIKAVGDSCAELNLGTTAYPNLIAAEGVAITADRASLLTCQSGVWSSNSAGSMFAMYLTAAVSIDPPNACPAGWIQADYSRTGYESVSSSPLYTRTCIASWPREPIYFSGAINQTIPSACPASWMQADYKRTGYDLVASSPIYTRTCY